jgi:hypothetical protein
MLRARYGGRPCESHEGPNQAIEDQSLSLNLMISHPVELKLLSFYNVKCAVSIRARKYLSAAP